MKYRSKLKLSKPAVSRYVEHEELRSKDKTSILGSSYPFIIRLFKI